MDAKHSGRLRTMHRFSDVQNIATDKNACRYRTLPNHMCPALYTSMDVEKVNSQHSSSELDLDLYNDFWTFGGTGPTGTI